MRPALLALVIAATTAHASPNKPVAADAGGDELLLLARARIAERLGDFDKAEDQYQRALRITKRPNTYWNLASIQRRGEQYRAAISTLETYKKLAVTDADRAEADAEIAAIKAAPMRVSLSGDDIEETYVFVDGVRKGTAPYLATFASGEGHVVDMLSATRFEHFRLETTLAMTDDKRLRALASGSKGNVILAGSYALHRQASWMIGSYDVTYPGRFSLPPGRYETQLDGNDRYVCNKIKFTVPANGSVFVFLAAPERATKGCTTATVTTHVVPL